MCETAITVKSFKFYIRRLSSFFQNDERARILSDPLIITLLDGNLLDNAFCLYADINVYFSDEEKPISDVANVIYQELINIYSDYPQNTNKKYAITELKIALYIKTLLRLIKYSCTVIQENKKKESIFQKRGLLDIIQSDNDLNPKEWVYLSEEQFMYKVIKSLEPDNSLFAICPTTNFRLLNILDNHNSFLVPPLLILSEQSFQASIQNLISKHVIKENATLSSSKYNHNDILYIGKMCSAFSSTHTKGFERLHSMLEKILRTKDYTNYEIIITAEYVPSRTHVVSVCYKLFVFLKEELGYSLYGFLSASYTSKEKRSIFYTKDVSWFLLDDILTSSLKFFEDELVDVQKSVSTNKMVSILSKLLSAYESDDSVPNIPELIVYPE